MPPTLMPPAEGEGTFFFRRTVAALQYIEAHPEVPIYVISDGFDVFVNPIDGPGLCDILKRAAAQPPGVVVSTEWNCWAYGVCSPQEAALWKGPPGRPRFPNAGAMLGTRQGLLALYQAMLKGTDEMEATVYDDQAALHQALQRQPGLAVLDFQERFFASGFRTFSKQAVPMASLRGRMRPRQWACATGPCYWDPEAAGSAAWEVSRAAGVRPRLRLHEGNRTVDPLLWHANGPDEVKALLAKAERRLRAGQPAPTRACQ